MHSKWLDLATEIAAFHYQSRRYDAFKPPSFGANPGIQSLDNHTSTVSLLSENQRSNPVTFDPDDNIVRGSPARAGPARTGEDLLPVGETRQKTAPSGLVRHAKSPTMSDLIQQMDNCEAKEAEMNRQSIPHEIIGDRTDDYVEESNEIYSGRSVYTDEEGGILPRKQKRSWLRKIRDRHSDARTVRKSKKLEEQMRRSDAMMTKRLDVANLNRSSNNANATRRQETNNEVRTGRGQRRHDRTKPQTATEHYFNRRSIGRSKSAALRDGRQLEFRDRFDAQSGKPYSIFTAVSRKHLRAGHLDPDAIPPLLFLEECAHLLSLMSAVAFSTLRNDLPEAESPLTVFEPGLPWPQVDPDNYRGKVRQDWTRSKYRAYVVFQFLLGRSRNDNARTLYNAARPFRVIGNVSDAEIEKLQEARGPLAKVTLVSMWLLELISREYQAGSTGDVAPPIISRIYQFVSEGLAGYNQARKIAYIPFPFPHAQITTLFMLIVDFFVTPLLMATYVTNVHLGFSLNLFSVMCFTGLHEVAREIENPFQNVPNDVPLNNYQAQFNEGLMVMFYGYHPDAYWKSGSDRPGHHNQDKSSSKIDAGVAKRDAERKRLRTEENYQLRVSEYSQDDTTHSRRQKQPFERHRSPRNDSIRTRELEPQFNVASSTEISDDNELQLKPQRNILFRVPMGTSVREEGSLMNTHDVEGTTKSADNGALISGRTKNNTSINDERAEDFLRNALSGSMGSSSGSILKGPPAEDSFRELKTDGMRQDRHSMQFRIPNRTEPSPQVLIPQIDVNFNDLDGEACNDGENDIFRFLTNN